MNAMSREATAQLFEAARTHGAWLDLPVEDDILRRAYELAEWGPTSANACPLRIVFVRSGFVLDAQSTLLANTDDPHSSKVFDPSMKGKTDRFAYRFVKP